MILSRFAARFKRQTTTSSRRETRPARTSSYKAKYLPATKIYELFAVPRSLLRAYADEGKVDTHRVKIPNCRHDMITYCVADVEKVLSE